MSCPESIEAQFSGMTFPEMTDAVAPSAPWWREPSERAVCVMDDYAPRVVDGTLAPEEARALVYRERGSR